MSISSDLLCFSVIARVRGPAAYRLTSNIWLKPKPFGLAKSQSVPMRGKPRGPGSLENGFRCWCWWADVTDVDSDLLMTSNDDDAFVT